MNKMKIAILTRPDYKSPRILAQTLQLKLKELGVESEIFFEINLLNRLVYYKHNTLKFHFWLSEKIKYWKSDKATINKIKEFDALIISECIPNAFERSRYNVEELRRRIAIPIMLYEVYFLGNAPSQLELLDKRKDASLERFDFHLSVSKVTEIRQEAFQNWYNIGINSKSWKLQPIPKNRLLAIVDFPQQGYEELRQIQIAALAEAGIEFITLKGNYTVDGIRQIYQQASMLFLQFPEAFGLPIAECLCSGAQIFTPDSGWPMAFRLNEDAKMYGPGVLADCFTVYDGYDDLVTKLKRFKNSFNNITTPKTIFESFIKNYPDFYYGNDDALRSLISDLKTKDVQ